MRNKNTLWSVKGAGATQYLLGTVHIARESDYPLDAAIECAYGSAEVVVAEADTGGVPDEEMGALLSARALYTSGEALRGGVSAETYSLMRDKAEELGMDMGEVERVKPWLLAMILANHVAARLGLDGKLGVDKYLVAKARADRKEVSFLETVEEQIDILAGMPPEVQDKFLLNTLTSFDEMGDSMERVNRAWLSGDVEALELLLDENSRKHPEANERIIYERNENWLPRVEAYAGSGRNHLLALGALHLVGERGILRALEEKGYDLEQL